MKKLFLSMAFLAIMLPLLADVAVTTPYSMGFEAFGADSIEAGNWVLNPGDATVNCPDKWYIGSAISGQGQQALYISGDGGSTASIGNGRSLQFAYRDVLLPAGTYEFSFDWYCEGSDSAYLAVGYATTSNTYIVASTSFMEVPVQVSLYLQKDSLHGSVNGVWRNEAFEFNSNGSRTYRFFFMWVNYAHVPTIGMSAAIDNVRIQNANCKRPYNVKAENLNCDSVRISWNGASAEYELQYSVHEKNSWQKIQGISGSTSSSVIVEGLRDTIYDFRVRGICTPDTSGWTDPVDFYVYCMDNRCINFIDLTDSLRVTCTCNCTERFCNYGYQGWNTNPDCAYRVTGVIDYGSEDMNSRHTVNYDRTAVDPRTNGQLSLIPTGQPVSVRLGNWDVYHHAESISYLYSVDISNFLLQIQYAMVCGGGGTMSESANESARFVIEILDEQGNVLNEAWAHTDVYPGSYHTWYQYHPSSSEVVEYIPWMTLNVDLRQYIGQNIKIRFTTYDCAQGGHYGYAYFTLDCLHAEDPFYTINAYGEHGTVTGSGEYPKDVQIQLEAIPDDGYVFRRWTDGPTDNPRTITVTRDASYEAIFKHVCQVSAEAVGGIVTGADSLYDEGTLVMLEAVPNEGYTFELWSDGISENPRAFYVTQDTMFYALFSAPTMPDIVFDTIAPHAVTVSWDLVPEAASYSFTLYDDNGPIADESSTATELNVQDLNAAQAYRYRWVARSAADQLLSTQSGEFVTANEQTGLLPVNANDPDASAPPYNILGQPVSDSYHGIVIRNGMKVLQ